MLCQMKNYYNGYAVKDIINMSTCLYFFISFPHTVQFLHFIKAPRITFSCYPLRAELQVVTSNDHSYVFVIYTIHMTLVL